MKGFYIFLLLCSFSLASKAQVERVQTLDRLAPLRLYDGYSALYNSQPEDEALSTRAAISSIEPGCIIKASRNESKPGL